MPSYNELLMMKALPLDIKILKTAQRVREFTNQCEAYISVSGGLQSTVLHWIINHELSHRGIPSIFCDTGLEYPEVKANALVLTGGEKIRPKMQFREVIERWGYPIIGKESAANIYTITQRNVCESNRNRIMNGINKDGSKSKYKLAEQWKPLLDAPFKIGDGCCNEMKKKPFKKYTRETGRKAITGTMTDESSLRLQNWMKHGCNTFTEGREKCAPLSFWTQQDILNLLILEKIPFPSVYGEIVTDEKGQLRTTKAQRTGCMFCMFCMFGIAYDTNEDSRFLRMETEHPAQHAFCFKKWQDGGLELQKPLDYLNEHCNLSIAYSKEKIIELREKKDHGQLNFF